MDDGFVFKNRAKDGLHADTWLLGPDSDAGATGESQQSVEHKAIREISAMKKAHVEARNDRAITETEMLVKTTQVSWESLEV